MFQMRGPKNFNTSAVNIDELEEVGRVRVKMRRMRGAEEWRC